jgi:hypothetical protein
MAENNLVGEPAELHMTIQVTRKATGKVEEYRLVGRCTKEEAEALGATPEVPAEKE